MLQTAAAEIIYGQVEALIKVLKKEKALWAGKPLVEMIESKAWIGLVVGPIAVLVGLSVCLVTGLLGFMNDAVAASLPRHSRRRAGAIEKPFSDPAEPGS